MASCTEELGYKWFILAAYAAGLIELGDVKPWVELAAGGCNCYRCVQSHMRIENGADAVGEGFKVLTGHVCLLDHVGIIPPPGTKVNRSFVKKK